MFFVRRAFTKVAPHCDIHEFNYAEDALGFLRTPDRPQLDMLLVDINMPRMSGFEFADAYAELYPELKGPAPVYILSSSLNPDDAAKAEAHPAISGFLQKPVGADTLRELYDAHNA